MRKPRKTAVSVTSLSSKFEYLATLRMHQTLRTSARDWSNSIKTPEACQISIKEIIITQTSLRTLISLREALLASSSIRQKLEDTQDHFGIKYSLKADMFGNLSCQLHRLKNLFLATNF